jgi:hypothetical protein
VNIINECLQYILELNKYIDFTNVECAKQSFSTLTEFIQGPCKGNQKFLSEQINIYGLVNDILSRDFALSSDYQKKDVLKYNDMLELKNNIVINLISIVSEKSGNNNDDSVDSNSEISALMRNSLDINNIIQQLDYITLLNTKIGNFI